MLDGWGRLYPAQPPRTPRTAPRTASANARASSRRRRYEDDAGPGEVEESARGRGLRRAIGELIICPYCVGMWVSAAFAAGLLVAPRFTRWFAAVLTALFGADVLQIAYKKAEDAM